MALVWLFLEKTPYGARVKAGAHDSEMVRALGINISRLRLFVFALGAALAALAGIILTPIWGLRPHVGVDAVIPSFLIIVLGGVGSFWGAVIAGLLVGITVGITGGYAAEWSVMSHVPALDPGAERPRARPDGQEERTRGLTMALYTPITRSRRRSKPGLGHPADAGRRWRCCSSFPFWAEIVGLYPYLGIEVAIWMVLRARLQSAARLHRAAGVRAGRVLRHRRRMPTASAI